MAFCVGGCAGCHLGWGDRESYPASGLGVFGLVDRVDGGGWAECSDDRFAEWRVVLALALDMDGGGLHADFGGRAVGDEPASGDDQDARTDAFDLGDDMGAEQDGAVRGELGDEGAGGAHLGGVEAVGGFVEDEDRRVVDDGGGEPDALAVSLAEHADAFVGHVGEPAPVDDAGDGGLSFGAAEAEEFGPIIEVLRRFEFVIEGCGFWEVAQAGACGDGVGVSVSGDAVPGEGDGAGIRGEVAGDHSDGGGFSGTVGPEEARDLAGLEGEGEIADRSGLAERFGCVFDNDHACVGEDTRGGTMAVAGVCCLVASGEPFARENRIWCGAAFGAGPRAARLCFVTRENREPL